MHHITRKLELEYEQTHPNREGAKNEIWNKNYSKIVSKKMPSSLRFFDMRRLVGPTTGNRSCH